MMAVTIVPLHSYGATAPEECIIRVQMVRYVGGFSTAIEVRGAHE